MFITDITHFLDENGNIPKEIPKEGRELAGFLGLIIDEITKGTKEPVEILRCIQIGCKGQINGKIQDTLNKEIHWRCNSCSSEGRIFNWQGTKWNNRLQGIYPTNPDGGSPPYSNDIPFERDRIDEIIEGYSPAEMIEIVNQPFMANSPVKLLKLEDYSGIPILNLFKYLLNRIHEQGEFKLTGTGCIPVKFVKEMYSLGHIKEYYIDSGLNKLSREQYSWSVTLTRNLVELSGLVKKRFNRFILSRAGEKILHDNYALLNTIVNVFATKISLANIDRYGNTPIAQQGFGFSLILLNLYGDEWRQNSFYSNKYFDAFPGLWIDAYINDFEDLLGYGHHCYSNRTFSRFLLSLGVIQTQKEGIFESSFMVAKTQLFDLMFKILPPGKK